MGEQKVSLVKNEVQMQQFVRQLLDDVKAFEYMLDNDWFESDIVRIGAEQEMCMVDQKTYKPACIAMDVLEQMTEYPWAETELAKFNIETNFVPRVFEGDALKKMEEEALYTQKIIREKLKDFDTKMILTGILPTLRKFDLEMHNLTPKPRYYALIEAISKQLSKNAFELQLEGIDELRINHNSPLLEACNTSFQVHLQVSPSNFVRYYNMAQALAGPIIAIAANSPIVFGRRLWHESRIALFQQALDTRKSNNHMRESSPRVNFGKDWLHHSILEIHKEDIARFRVLLAGDVTEDSLQMIQEGKIPKLRALQVFNSTVYRWNRPCYGISDTGKPHLRIENRVLPSGPTVADEMANAAFWLGAMVGMGDLVEDITQTVSFEDVRDNFMKAAQYGIDSEFNWANEQKIGACDLILKELLPIARKGLEKQKVNSEDIDRYLGIIEARAKKHMNGARWQLRAFTKLKKQVTPDEAAAVLTASIIKNQEKEIPVHLWEMPQPTDLKEYVPAKLRVAEFMQTDLFTVQKDDIVELVAEMMDWRKIRYMPVENKEGQLVGLITSRALIRYYARKSDKRQDQSSNIVKDIMIENPITVTSEVSITDALELMRSNKIGCLPVVEDQELIGVITEMDFLRVSVRLMERLER
ncbi:MAG: glutamate-cysteine ligase family protein [Bacteroidota bacterium]